MKRIHSPLAYLLLVSISAFAGCASDPFKVPPRFTVQVCDPTEAPIAEAEIQIVSMPKHTFYYCAFSDKDETTRTSFGMTNPRGEVVVERSKIPYHSDTRTWMRVVKDGYHTANVDLPWFDASTRIVLVPISDFCETHLGQQVVLDGIAQNWNRVPVLLAKKGRFFLYDLSAWPADIVDKRVSVSGTIVVSIDKLYTPTMASSDDSEDRPEVFITRSAAIDAIRSGRVGAIASGRAGLGGISLINKHGLDLAPASQPGPVDRLIEALSYYEDHKRYLLQNVTLTPPQVRINP